MSKDELVIASVKLLGEFLNAAGLDWDEAYFRYVEHRDEDAFTSQWSCRKGRYMKIYKVDGEFSDGYIERLEKWMDSLCSTIEADGHTRPVVVVFRVDRTGNYRMMFEMQDVKAMQIDSLHVGKPNSLFNAGEVMVEE